MLAAAANLGTYAAEINSSSEPSPNSTAEPLHRYFSVNVEKVLHPRLKFLSRVLCREPLYHFWDNGQK